MSEESVNWFYPIQDSNNTCCCKHGYEPCGSTQARTYFTAAASINMSRRILHIGFSICYKTAFKCIIPAGSWRRVRIRIGKEIAIVFQLPDLFNPARTYVEALSRNNES